MGKFDHRSRDQKRKAKLKRRSERSSKHESLAYHGSKYKTAEYAPFMHRTEIGIFETYVMSDRTLTDDDVEAALENLILQLRQKALPPMGAGGPDTGESEDLIAWNIRRNWEYFAEQQPLPRHEDLIGVLRTLLGSLEFWRAKNMHPQGYLRMVEDLMKQTGVRVQVSGPETRVFPADEDPGEDDYETLLDLGREWTSAADRAAEKEFTEEVEAALAAGDAELVIAVCQQLLHETGNNAATTALEAYLRRGQKALQGPSGAAGLPEGS